ncbi:MAG: alpha-N-arabinofuranosidase [Eubacteriales bacterium]|nr:alpha-N-arabinofuranosidase [Eubacteriales bacterium]
MARLYINPEKKKGKIHKELYGHFSEHLGRCIYEGVYVGENSPIPNTNGMRNDVVEALKEMQIPVLRWPGGCFADEYHWKDGIGPKETRKRMVNTNWGGVVEDNSFGTHEYMELCRQLGCENYINGNVGSGTVQEMAEWVEYLTFDGISPMAELRKENGQEKPWQVDFFGVGNENWGCGGNMRPEFYADQYRRYQTYVKQHQEKKIYKIACGPNAADYEWTEKVMQIAGNFMDGLSLHYYTVPSGNWGQKGSATEFDEETYYRTLKKTLFMEELLDKHTAIMDRYDPEKRIGLIVDEWGTWYDVEPGTNPGFLYQQNTMRDAMVAAINLNLFNHRCDRVRMANIAQLVNVLQAVILTEGERMVKTPTYHVFEMFKHHQDAELLDSWLECSEIETKDGVIPQISESVSVNADGEVHITLANLSADKECPMEICLQEAAGKVRGEILTGEIHQMNTFTEPETVKKEAFTAFTVEGDVLKFTMPPCSVIHFAVSE